MKPKLCSPEIIGMLFVSILLLGSCKKTSDNPGDPPPSKLTITKILPDSGGYMTLVTITGIGFNSVIANNVVKFNNQIAVIKSASPTELQAEVPKGAGTGTVTVKTGNDIATGPAFKYLKTATVSTLAGSGDAGFADGSGTAAQFNDPAGMAIDMHGDIYLADYGNNRIRKITSDGVVSNFAGSGIAGYADGDAATAQFNGPIAVAVDITGNVYVIENNLVRKISALGIVSTLAGSITPGYADGNGLSAQFQGLAGITIDDQATLYVSDANRIRKITAAGAVSTLAGSGSPGYVDGTDTTAQFNTPYGLTIDSQGNIFVADGTNDGIRKITPEGLVSSVPETYVTAPVGVAFNTNGDLYILVSWTSAERYIVKKYTNGFSYYFAGLETGGNGYVDGPGAIAQFNNPYAIAVDASDNIYIADTGNNRIRKIISE